MNATPFQRTPWMTTEIRRIARTRFGAEYWPAIEEALLNCLENHSVVVKSPNDDKRIAAFVLVCPPTTSSSVAYGIEESLPLHCLEVAFVATDVGWEGRGYARDLMEAVLFRCKITQEPAWLHVDAINQKAHAFYERLGFQNFLHIPDPYGSPGVIMIYLPSRPWRYHNALQRPTLRNASPCEPEQPLRRSILAPPRMTCC
jgi:ribosomal protein S18 acetylase RimI-like enzyme